MRKKVPKEVRNFIDNLLKNKTFSSAKPSKSELGKTAKAEENKDDTESRFEGYNPNKNTSSI